MAKIGLAHQNNQGYQFGAWYSHNSDFNQLEDIHSTALTVNPSTTDFGLLSVNLNIDLSKTLGISNVYKPKLSVFVNNLLQETIYYPELSRKIVNSIQLPHQSGVYVKLSMSF